MKHFTILHAENYEPLSAMIATINNVTIDKWGANRFIERLTSELHNFSTSCKLSQIEYFKKIYAIGINTVTCGNCGGVLFHSIGQEGYLTCPHCQIVSDPCNFPDFF